MPGVNITDLAIIKFIKDAKIAYQSMGKEIPNTMVTRTSIEGEDIRYPILGAIQSLPIAQHSTVVSQDPGATTVTGKMESFGAAIQQTRIGQSFTNTQLQADYIRILTAANKRRMDQVAFDAMNVAPAFTQPTNATNLTYDKLLATNLRFSQLNVPLEERIFIGTPETEKALMNDEKFINNEFFNKGAVKAGTLNGSEVLGMKFITVGEMTEGGLPKNGNIVTCFSYQKEAMGYATGLTADISIDRIPLRWQDVLIQAIMTLNCTVIDIKGLQKIDVDITK